jgi:sec-independent protein translocase protein TatC
MAEEPDATESSPGDDPDEGTPSDGDSVDSEVEPTVEPEVDPETTTGDPDAAEETDTDGGDEGNEPEADASTDGTDEPIGAVTDATSPPAESAPGVAADREAAGAEPDDTDTDTDDTDTDTDTDDTDTDTDDTDTDTDDTDREENGVDPAEVNHAVPPEAMDEGGLKPAEGSQRSPEADAAGAEADATGGAAATEPTPAPSPASGPSKDPEITHPDGPPDDEEMPLADHVEEMVLRLAVVSAVATVVAGTVFFFEPLAEDMILFIWNSVIPWDSPVPDTVAGTAHPVHFVGESTVSSNPRVYGPLELKLSELKFASLVGFILALPVFVYETYRFMRPGLYPHERRYYLAAVPTSLVLAFVGVSFAYFVILPAIFAYFIRYSRAAGALAFALRSTFDLILVLMGYMALVFQIPLFIMLAIMMGLTDRRWLEDKRLYFWGGFLGVSFLFVPEPTGMAPILVALTMIGLYEGTLALLRWTGN